MCLSNLGTSAIPDYTEIRDNRFERNTPIVFRGPPGALAGVTGNFLENTSHSKNN